MGRGFDPLTSHACLFGGEFAALPESGTRRAQHGFHPCKPARSLPSMTSFAAMLEAGGRGTSDLLFVVGQPPQVEINGVLTPSPSSRFAAGRSNRSIPQRFADSSSATTSGCGADLTDNGSCDTSYSLAGAARFRVNIFRQSGQHAIVMRKLSTEDPVARGPRPAADFQGDHQGKDRPRLLHRRDWLRQDDDARGDAERDQPDRRACTS